MAEAAGKPRHGYFVQADTSASVDGHWSSESTAISQAFSSPTRCPCESTAD